MVCEAIAAGLCFDATVLTSMRVASRRRYGFNGSSRQRSPSLFHRTQIYTVEHHHTTEKSINVVINVLLLLSEDFSS